MSFRWWSCHKIIKAKFFLCLSHDKPQATEMKGSSSGSPRFDLGEWKKGNGSTCCHFCQKMSSTATIPGRQRVWRHTEPWRSVSISTPNVMLSGTWWWWMTTQFHRESDAMEFFRCNQQGIDDWDYIDERRIQERRLLGSAATYISQDYKTCRPQPLQSMYGQ